MRRRDLPDPKCPICGRDATRHCKQPGCLLFECLACDVWGGRHTDWHPRTTTPGRTP
jgi:hypothetical protein